MIILTPRGVTLVELLVALAVASLLMLGVIAAFQTTQRTAAIGEAREHIYQNARVALDLMAKDIKGAYIDNRNRDLVFISADGLAGRGSSVIEFNPSPPAAPANLSVIGIGNAQTPHGIPTTRFSSGDLTAFDLYADATSGDAYATRFSVKALDQNGFPKPGLPPGPPDRLDLTCLTTNFPGNTTNQSRLAEVRYVITTEVFDDDEDNDYDGAEDGADNSPPGAGGLTGLGDMIPMDWQTQIDKDFNLDAEAGRRIIKALNLFHLRRGIGVDTAAGAPKPVVVDKNPFSTFEMATGDGSPADPQGRYPDRSFTDFTHTNYGENVGSYIYDLQFEFYGRIALALDPATGAPNTWGVGWGYQDVRGEDTGLIDDGDAVNEDGEGPNAVDDGTVYNQGAPNAETIYGSGTSWDSIPKTGGGTVDLAGGIFFVLPSGSDEATEFDVADPANDVYRIASVTDDVTIVLDRPYAGATIPLAGTLPYRIIEPAQANGILDEVNTTYPEDLGSDGLVNDPLDDIVYLGMPTGVQNNISDNDGTTAENSVGENNNRLDSRVMGIWDSRSPDPRNPNRAAELNRVDSDGDEGTLKIDGIDNDLDGVFDGSDDQYGVDAASTPEIDNPGTPGYDESNDLKDDALDNDGIADDRFYDPAGRREGIDELDEANPDDDSLPKAVRITIAVSDPVQAVETVVLSTTVWLSTAK